METYLAHYGILGMKWGVRRYQNKDGTLTELGRKRLGLDLYEKAHPYDTIIKKGTKASRVISTPDYYEKLTHPRYGSPEKAKKYIDDLLKQENSYDRKYVSVEGVKNSQRADGKEFYLSWFTEGGWDPDGAMVSTYEFKKDAKIASGKQVVDELLKEVGSTRISTLLKENRNFGTLALEYTNNKELFNKINKLFADRGYDGIEDINDPDTDMPVILLNAKKTLGKPISTQSGQDAIDDIIKKRKNNI